MEFEIAEANRNYIKAEERVEIMEEALISQKTYKPKIKEDNSDQIIFF